MKISVDRELCEGSGMCVEIAPELFELGEDDGLAVVRGDGSVPAGLEGKAIEAAETCPVQAILAQH